MRKIKLLFILGTFFPAQAGGPDSSIYWLNKAFLKLKQKCECLVLSFFYSLNQKDIRKYKIVPNKICKINGVKVIFLKFTFFRILSFSFYKFLFFNLKKYDIVHLNFTYAIEFYKILRQSSQCWDLTPLTITASLLLLLLIIILYF